MRNYLDFRSLVAISLAISLQFIFISCDKEPVDERPELPPVESLVMDYSDFSEPPGGVKGTEETYVNFYHSYFTLLFWNAATTVHMALPVAAYGHALQQTPVYLGDRTWEWSFEFSFENQNYTATLTGSRISNEEFSMEMVIALSAAPDQGRRWFDGVVRYDHTHATWNLYKDGSVVVLEAEWNKNYETDEADLTYTYVEEGQGETGSYIKLAYMPEEFFDAVYTISLAANETIIQWSTTTLEGRIQDTGKFEDSNWHCWDSAANGLADKICD